MGDDVRLKLVGGFLTGELVAAIVGGIGLIALARVEKTYSEMVDVCIRLRDDAR